MKTKPVIHSSDARLPGQTTKLAHRMKLPAGLFLKVVCAMAVFFASIEAHAGGILTTLYSFPGFATNGPETDSMYPEGNLIFGGDGNLYGTTGGAIRAGDGPQIPLEWDEGPYGSVFQISTNGTLTNLFYFGSVATRTNIPAYFPLDGRGPSGGLVLGNDGYFYGTTAFGGSNFSGIEGVGTMFKVSPTGTLTVLHRFSMFSTNEGNTPVGGLILGSDGFFYGATFHGENSDGSNFLQTSTLFKADTNGTITTLYQFTNGGDGYYTLAAPTLGADGFLYGTSDATVFKMSTNGEISILYTFTGYEEMLGPCPSALIQGVDGCFYGTTFLGGSNGAGTVFKITTNGTFTTLYSFTGANADANPGAALVQGSDGYLYGTTYGPPHFVGDPAGNVFQISTNGAYTSLYTFTGGSDGLCPAGGLVQGSDGSFYGTTEYGGINPGPDQVGDGTVFRLTIVPTPQAAVQTNDKLNLTWSAEKGGRYQLQCTSDLSSGSWVNMGSSVTATGSTVSLSDSITNSPQRFYRLMPVLN